MTIAEIKKDLAKVMRGLGVVILAGLFAYGGILAQTQPTAQQLIEQGRAYGLQKQYDKAAQAYTDAIKLEPESSTAHAGLGATFIGMGRNAEAIDSLKLAISLDAKSVMAHVNLGAAYSNLRRFDEAISALTEAKRLRPDDAQIHTILGGFLGDAGRPEEALANFRRATELAPRQGANFHNIGLLYNRMGKFAEAIEPLKTAVKLAPKLQSAFFNLGLAYSRTGKYAEAIESFTAVLELAPNDPQGLINRGWNYLYAGSSGREAAGDAEKYLALYGWRRDSSPYQGLAAILGYRVAGMDAEAVVLTQEALKKADPSIWAYNIFRFLGGEIRADELLKIAANNDQRTEARTYIGMDLKLRGRTDEAKVHLGWVKQFGNGGFVEHTLAIAELGR